MRLHLCLLAGATALTFAPLGFAQAPDGEAEIIVTAPLEGAVVESLQGATVLDRAETLARLSGGIGETLAGLPGVESTFFGAGASRPIIRGLGDDRVRFLQNGVGAIDAASVSPDHAATSDGLDAERIEVLRGPAALAYGGNAIGGVVNVIDQSIPTAAPDGAVGGEAYLASTSADEGWQGALAVAGRAGPIVARLSGGIREAGDFEIPGYARSAALRAASPPDDPAEEPRGEAPNSFTDVRTLTAGAAFVDGWGHAGLAVKRYETVYGLPPEPDEGGPRIDLEQTRIEARGDVAIALGPFDRIDFAMQHSDYEHAELEPDGEVGTLFESDGFEARAEAHFAASAGAWKGAIGLQGLNTDFDARGEEAFLTATNTQEIGAFTVQRAKLGGMTLEGGLRVERRNLDNDGQGERDFTAFSAAIGASAQPAPGWFLGATLARTERAPTAYELFADGPHAATGAFEIGDSGLEKEVALSIEGVARFGAPRFTLEASLYGVQFDGFIALLPNGEEEDELPVYLYVQEDADFIGGELSAAAKLFDAGPFALSADAALDLVRAEFDGGGNLPRIPPRRLTLGLGAQSSWAEARLEVVDIAEQDRTAAFETATDGATLVNARLTLSPFAARRDLRLILDGRNLTNEETRAHTSFLKDAIPRPGRTVRAG
jgi:iron complex outermembrane receptor protein